MTVDHGTRTRYRYGCRCDDCRSASTVSKRAQVAENKRRLAEGYDPGNHGRYSTYSNWGCRCEACTEAWATYCSNRKAQRVAALAAGEVEVPHGVYTTYGNYGCRCRPCTDAHVEAHRKYERSGQYV